MTAGPGIDMSGWLREPPWAGESSPGVGQKSSRPPPGFAVDQSGWKPEAELAHWRPAAGNREYRDKRVVSVHGWPPKRFTMPFQALSDRQLPRTEGLSHQRVTSKRPTRPGHRLRRSGL